MRSTESPKIRGNILVIDDTPQNVQILSEILSKEGYAMTSAGDGEAGLARALQTKPDLVLLDLVLPGMMGIEVLEILKREQPETAIVLTTAYGSEETAIQAMRRGVQDYIINKRPFDPIEVREVVRRAIAEARLRHENTRLTRELELANDQLQEYAANLEKTVVELRNANARLQEMDRLKASFFSMISHELRHPLTVAKGYIELVETGEASGLSATNEQYLHIVRDNLNQLAGMIDDLLDLSRMEAGRFQIEQQFIKPQTFVHHAVQAFMQSAREKGLTLESQLTDALPLVNADPLRVVQVLSNLLQNAIKFTPAGGCVSITGHALENEVEFCVQDTGIGIPEKDRDKIFERFYQVQRTESNHGGAGLGLSICREIMRLHGGRIWVESAEGQYSKFYFTLPRAPAEQPE